MYKLFIEIWFTYYEKRTGEKYIFDGKDGRHLKQLMKKVETKLTQKGMEVSEANLTNSFRGLLDSIKDPWMLDNLEVSLINSKFNSIYGKAVRNNPFTAADRIDEIIARRNYQGTK